MAEAEVAEAEAGWGWDGNFSLEKPSSNEAITEIAMTYMLPPVPDEMYWPCCTQPIVPYKIHMYHLALHALSSVTLYTNEWITTRYENITT